MNFHDFVADLKQKLAIPAILDEAGQREAALLDTIGWLTIAVSCLRIISPGVDDPLVNLIVNSVVIAIVLSILQLKKRGHVRTASILFVAFLWIVISVTNFFQGGVRGAGFSSYVTIILMAGLLLSGKAAIGVSALSLAVGTVLFFLEREGVVRPDPGMLSIDMMYVAVVPSFIITGGLVYLYQKGLSEALIQIRENEQRLLEGNRDLEAIRLSLEEQVDIRTQGAEQARQAAEAANQALREQVWQVTELSKLNEAMRHLQSLDDLARCVVKQLCHVLSVPVGLLYLREGNRFDLMASFAYTPREGRSLSFEMGEGLVGEAALEARWITIANVKPELLAISSASTTLLPAYLLIVPCVHKAEVVGVLEFGLLKPLTTVQRAFLERAMAEVAMAFNTIQTHTRMEELLTETRHQATILQAQEVELRAINEELRSQTEAAQSASQYARQKPE
ncbi:MAG: GAF domain-containing protein [Anaerolineae bacterium]|nr:GAF domain-containing protein [Anaerolineae bacterium]